MVFLIPLVDRFLESNMVVIVQLIAVILRFIALLSQYAIPITQYHI